MEYRSVSVGGEHFPRLTVLSSTLWRSPRLNVLYTEITGTRLEIAVRGAKLEMGPSLTMDCALDFPVPPRELRSLFDHPACQNAGLH